jgi:hypothetical protein
VSEFKFVSAFRVPPASVLFSRSVESRQSRGPEVPVSVSTSVPRLSSRSSSVALRRVASEYPLRPAYQLRSAYPPKATSPGRPSTPKSVLSSALLKARRAARAELFTSIASRLAALKVPSFVELRPVALRKRPRFLS